MKRLLMLIPLVFLCCLAVGCISRDYVAPTDVEADIQAIKDVVAELNTAANSADLDKFMSFYTDDAVVMPPNMPADIGKEVIRVKAQQFFDEVTQQEEVAVEDVEISYDLAVARVTWSGINTPHDGSEPSKGNGNWIMVFEKQSDNSWKIIYSIWSDETLVRPTQTE